MDPADQPPPVDDAEPAAASSEDRVHPGPATPRSYECSFCKRGFSNAQALGGHMNIHRKDRAKLKHPASHHAHAHAHAQFPFDITPAPAPAPAPYSPVLAAARGAVSFHHPSSSPVIRQLPLFVEAPSSYGDAYNRSSSEIEHGQGPVELDLELRLGPERPDSSSPAMGLNEFV